MWPFFCFYGGKWRAAPHYPRPAFTSVVEPFASAAGYATRFENGRHEAASHGSMLMGFGVDLSPLSQLGTVFGAHVAAPGHIGRVSA